MGKEENKQSVWPGTLAILIVQILFTGVLALGRLLPIPLPWTAVFAPIWLPPILLVYSAIIWKSLGGRVFK